nr:MAG TPA: hypothetical protein [Caudoviricetes sp.]
MFLPNQSPPFEILQPKNHNQINDCDFLLNLMLLLFLYPYLLLFLMFLTNYEQIIFLFINYIPW